MAPEGLGSESWWKWWARGSGFFCKNFIPFHPLLPPEKAKFLWISLIFLISSWHGSLSRWLPVDHSSTKKGILDIDPMHWTLCPSITSTCSTSKFCFNTFQYSIGGTVTLEAITYSQDCTSKKQSFLMCNPSNFCNSKMKKCCKHGHVLHGICFCLLTPYENPHLGGGVSVQESFSKLSVHS